MREEEVVEKEEEKVEEEEEKEEKEEEKVEEEEVQIVLEKSPAGPVSEDSEGSSSDSSGRLILISAGTRQLEFFFT